MKIKENMFYDIENHMLYNKKPSDFLNFISNDITFSEYPFSLLLRLKTTDQNIEHHPEGSVWNHTLLVIDEAAKCKDKSTDAKIFMWAALLHDIGKPDTTKIKKGKITSYDHDKVGKEISIKFLSEFNLDKSFIKGVSELVRWHMQILYVVRNLPFADVKSMKKKVNINDVALLGLCDRLGRGRVNIKKEMDNIDIFLSKAR